MSTPLFKTKTRSYLLPFILVASLFFLWGVAHAILDVLNKHFQDVFEMTRTRSALVQAMVYGGYFLMALPAGAIIRRWGYRRGVVTGLALYGIGALMFIPGSGIGAFPFFLLSLFIIGCGLTCLETAANPYVTVLGPPETAERRINMAQALNGLGWIVGPIIGGMFVLSDDANVATPYAIIGAVVLAIMAVFMFIPLPEIFEAEETTNEATSPLLRKPHFLLGLLALFLYVAAQTGINSFFINYAVETADVPQRQAAYWLGMLGMGLFMVGRLLGSIAMKYVRPDTVLTLCAVGALASMAVVTLVGGRPGYYALFAALFFESIMFPTIFALALRNLGPARKTASSLLIMTIVGGAVAPLAMGAIADAHGTMAPAFIIPLLCFGVITAYAATYRHLLR